MAKGELTFNDYLEKKFFVGNDFKCYKYDEGDFSKIEHSHIEEGFIEVVDFVEVSDSTNEGILTEVKGKITEDTFRQINSHIYENFFIEVEKQFSEIKTKFGKSLSNYYDKPYLIEAETNTIKQILRGQKNSIVDTFGITHIVIKYVNGMPIVESELLKLSPAFNINTTTLSDIRKYMANEYGLKDSKLYFIKNPLFANKHKSYIMAEAFIRYFDFLRNSAVTSFLIETEPPDAKKPAAPKTVTDYPELDEKEKIVHGLELKIPKALSFRKENYKIDRYNWEKEHNNKLTTWLKNGQMIEVEKWLFVSRERFHEQKQTLDELSGLMDITLINISDMHDEIQIICEQKANGIEKLLDGFFAKSNDMHITLPFYSLCPRIIKQPFYLIEAYDKYRDDLPVHKRIYYRYEYLNEKLDFGKDKFLEYRKRLAKIIRTDISVENKTLVNSVFLFIEQFIEELAELHRAHFNYYNSPLFRLLFEEIMKFKGYYAAAFNQFTFRNILRMKELLESFNMPIQEPSVSQLPNSSTKFPKSEKNEEKLYFDDPINEVSITIASGNKYNLNSCKKDHQKQETLVAGFCIYFLWRKKQAEIEKEKSDAYPKWVKPSFFEEYYDPICDQAKGEIPPDKEFPVYEFLSNQIQTEKKSLDKLLTLPGYNPPYDIQSLKKWTKAYITWLKKQLPKTELIGFSTKLRDKTIRKVYQIMSDGKYLKTSGDYFLDVFRGVARRNIPVLWLVEGQSGKNVGRGNQTALYEFLKLMLGKVSNKDLITAHHLFEDEQGKFTNGKLNRANQKKLSNIGYEDNIKRLIEEAYKNITD